MIRRPTAYVVALLAVYAGAIILPSLGWAASGGSGLQPSTGSSSIPNVGSGSGSVVQAGNITVTATGNGITLATRASTFLHGQLRFSGSVPAADAGRVVELERFGHETGWRWAPTAHSRARGNGSFSLVWSTNHIGMFKVRVVVERPRTAHLTAVSPAVTVTVYRQAIATQYGPGFYGSTTACGERLGRRTLGVANRTLPCGTPVAIYYRGRTIVVPVIDRGPYANHADFDLTEATGRALGMEGTAVIGAVSLPRRR